MANAARHTDPVIPDLFRDPSCRADNGRWDTRHAGCRDKPGMTKEEAGFTPAGRSAEHGFTLVEVLVSLMIFGLLAAAGVAILSFSVRAQTATGAKLDDLSALTRSFSVLSADLAQASLRPMRDEAGTTLPAFVGESGSNSVPMLRFVRAGWSNIDGAPRAAMQKVAYRLDGDTLQRVAFPMIDGAAPLPPAALLTHVRQVTLRYRIAGAWNDRWDGSQGTPMPEAMDVAIERADGRVYHQMFLVGTGYATPAGASTPFPSPTPNPTPGAPDAPR